MRTARWLGQLGRPPVRRHFSGDLRAGLARKPAFSKIRQPLSIGRGLVRRPHRDGFSPRRSDMNTKGISLAACLFVAACGAGTDERLTSAEPKAYVEMSFEERALFMNDVVLPEMKKTFTAFD